MYALLDKMNILQIDVDKNPGPPSVLKSLYRLERLAAKDQASVQAIAWHAFIGTTGQAWCEGTGYDLQKLKNMLINWMRARRFPQLL